MALALAFGMPLSAFPQSSQPTATTNMHDVQRSVEVRML